MLLNQDRKVPEYPSEYVMAEFFILRKYRRQGIGKQVVQQVFTQFSCTWEVSVVLANEPAARFWAEVIADHTNGDHQMVNWRNKSLPRTIYLFQS